MCELLFALENSNLRFYFPGHKGYGHSSWTRARVGVSNNSIWDSIQWCSPSGMWFAPVTNASFSSLLSWKRTGTRKWWCSSPRACLWSSTTSCWTTSTSPVCPSTGSKSRQNGQPPSFSIATQIQVFQYLIEFTCSWGRILWINCGVQVSCCARTSLLEVSTFLTLIGLSSMIHQMTPRSTFTG